MANEDFVRERCDWEEFQDWAAFVADPRHAPEAVESVTGVPAADLRGAARLYATGGNAAIVSAFADAARDSRAFIAHDLDLENLALLRHGQLSAVLHHDLGLDLRRVRRRGYALAARSGAGSHRRGG